ncbi:30S ribosomal protein S6 [Patescibacteria group bacterium]|nr:30S ribosomal protein S6 [Patescibacteria group bacterium]
MKNYELTYLISPDLSEEELKIFSGKISNFIQEETGTLEKTTEPSKKKLGYPIKKKEEAFLVALNFSLNPEKLGSLEKKLKSENQILRYVILTKKTPEKILRPRRTSLGLATEETLPKIKKPPKVPPKITEPKKVELKEIDKKIEEILGE